MSYKLSKITSVLTYKVDDLIRKSSGSAFDNSLWENGKESLYFVKWLAQYTLNIKIDM